MKLSISQQSDIIRKMMIDYPRTAQMHRLNTQQFEILHYVKKWSDATIEDIAKHLKTCVPHAKGKVDVMVKRGFLVKTGNTYSVEVIE